MSFFLEFELNNRELAGKGDSQVYMGEIVVNSKLKNVDLAEFLDELGQLHPKTLLSVLAHLNESFIACFPDGIDVVNALATLVRALGRVNDVVLS